MNPTSAHLTLLVHAAMTVKFIDGTSSALKGVDFLIFEKMKLLSKDGIKVQLGIKFDCFLVSSSVGLSNSSSCNRSPKQLFRHNLGSKAKNFNEDRYFCKIRMSQIRLAL